MKRRRRTHLSGAAVTPHANAATEAAQHGHCTKAFESLSTAQTAYGKTGGGREALGEARQTFFRKCVVPR